MQKKRRKRKKALGVNPVNAESVSDSYDYRRMENGEWRTVAQRFPFLHSPFSILPSPFFIT
jgi:hypothetical protein